MIKKLIDWARPNPFDHLIKKMAGENKSRFLIVWNRGLGDIPLGLYALVYRIREFIPHSSITFLTRKDLAEAFLMLEDVHVLIASKWKRGEEACLSDALIEHNLSNNMFDVILEKPDPTKWFKWQLGTLTPKLIWNDRWDALCSSFKIDLRKTYIGAHIQTETGEYYGYEKNWDIPSWRNLFNRIYEEKKGTILLFGMKKEPAFLMDHVIDLRGQTSLFEMLSLIKNCCRYLIVPDSGVLSTTYYLNIDFPIRIVSLWSDPYQGVLRQAVDSPNQLMKHIPLAGKDKMVTNIDEKTVYDALFGFA